MKKNLITMTILLLAAISLTSCSKETTPIEQSSNGYTVSIRATKAETKAVADDGAATFVEGDIVYVYNNTRSAWDANHLTAESAGKSTTFSGTLAGTYKKDDVLTLYYKTTSAGIIDNNTQDGALGNAKDAAKAVVTITEEPAGGTIVTSNASFTNLQSIFKFQFKNNGEVINNIRFVRVFSVGNKVQAQYDAKNDSPTYNPVTVSRSDNLANSYIYAALRFDKTPNDPIVFQVIDADGKVYSGSKAAPTSGFENGKFYNSTVDVNLYTFTVASGKKVCFSPGDLGKDGDVYSFTEPFTDWANNVTTVTTVPSKRSWFNYDEVDASTDPATQLYGITWRCENYVSSAYEWNNIIGRTMTAGVSPYYKVTVNGISNCLLLPPDEATSEDIGSDLTSGTVGSDYIKYLGKGFVLLMNAKQGTYNGTKKKISWSSTYFEYWSLRNTSNRYRLQWTSSATPSVISTGSQYRVHVRLVHDVTIE